MIRITKRFLVLPYVTRNCEEIVRRVRLKKTVNESFPQVEFNVAFQAPMTIGGKLFPFKDNIKSVFECSLVVYSIRCLAMPLMI